MEFGERFPPSGVFEGGDDGFDAFWALWVAFLRMFFVACGVEVDEGVHFCDQWSVFRRPLDLSQIRI